MANQLPKRSQMIDNHIKAIREAVGSKVEAGWFESDRYGGTKKDSIGAPVAKIARINEFGATITRGEGTIVIPARPFMRGAWMKFKNDRKKIQEKIARQIIERKITGDQAMAQIGLILEGYIVKSIKDGGWQGNADPTIKKKRFDKPLIDTGHMWKTVTSKVS
jgi:hypothetical protein